VHFADVALQSLQSQTYPARLIHIYLYVDGPVGPEHTALIEKWHPLIHRVILGPENLGLAHGLNVLLSSVQDEVYLFRMDLDDVSLPTRIEQQVRYMEATPRIDLLGCNSCEINETGVLLYKRTYPETHYSIVNRLPRCNPMLHPTYCIRTSTWKRDPVFYRNLYLNEDLGFLFDVTRKGWHMHNLQERLFQWRTGKSFFGRRKFRRSLVELNTYISGIRSLWGISPRLFWPFVRFASRLLPSPLARLLYRWDLRNRLLG
jgi:glycosyltransferase involved in cell wall biosynthesis